MKNIRFPIDCPPDCPYHDCWDLSIDDYTHVCHKLNRQIDDYDCGFTAFLPFCPIDIEKEMKRQKRFVLLKNLFKKIIQKGENNEG